MQAKGIMEHNKLKRDRRTFGNGSHGSKTRKLCCFYKIMVSPKQSKKLGLPEGFKRAFGDRLLGACCKLTVPTGETHRVAVVEKGNRLWFQKGWPEFVERFSIGCGYFMTFTYDGNINFRVNVFNLTEICYECHGNSALEVTDFEESDEGSQFAMDSEDDQEASPDNTEEEIEKECEFMLENKLPEWLMFYRDEIKAVLAAKIPIPTNPFFVVSIKKYSVTNQGYLTTPTGFCRAHMKCKTGNAVLLKMTGGREWQMRWYVTHLNRWNFGKGWVKFVREASLNVGDVCLFELIDPVNYVFNVRQVRLVLH